MEETLTTTRWVDTALEYIYSWEPFVARTAVLGKGVSNVVVFLCKNCPVAFGKKLTLNSIALQLPTLFVIRWYS